MLATHTRPPGFRLAYLSQPLRATHVMPAALAARRPMPESSITTHL